MSRSRESSFAQTLGEMNQNVADWEKTYPNAKHSYIELLRALISLTNPSFTYDYQRAVNTIAIPEEWKNDSLCRATLQMFFSNFVIAITLERERQVNYGVFFELDQAIEKLTTEIPSVVPLLPSAESSQRTQKFHFLRRLFTSSKS
jgi:hypothetical protein